MRTSLFTRTSYQKGRSLKDRFDDLYLAEPNSGCWLWIGKIGQHGYGIFAADGYTHLRAHRVSWSIYVGDIPHGRMVLHRCDVRCCVNPSHLFIGSSKDNTADMDIKGRRGLKKINLEIAKEIFLSEESPTNLAALHGVSKGLIYNIKAGIVWKRATQSDKKAATP